MQSNRQDHLRNREAKWQFRRRLVLEVARLLQTQPNQTWPKVSHTLEILSSSPSPTIRRNTKRWVRFAGNTPAKTVQTIQSLFAVDTPEGRRRHKLQDLSDGHPFSGLIPASTLEKLRQDASSEASSKIRESLAQ